MSKRSATTSRPKLTQPLKWHGGKSYLAPWIISHMPPRVRNPNAPAADDPGFCHYVEVFFGGGAVLLRQDPVGISEVVNDVDGALVNFWIVLREEKYFTELRRLCEFTPVSDVSFRAAQAVLADHWDETGCRDHNPCVQCAFAMFVAVRQSRQAMKKCFTTLTRNRTRSGMQETVSSWLGAIDGLAEVHARLQRVVILNDDFEKVIKQQDGPRTLFYCDCPYLHETRTVPDAYAHEMSIDDHWRLLKVLSTIKGRFMLSGYPSAMYEDWAFAHEWSCDSREIDNKASSKKEKDKEVECLWRNF